jgi:glycerol-3-phosphate dehydrogenase
MGLLNKTRNCRGIGTSLVLRHRQIEAKNNRHRKVMPAQHLVYSRLSLMLLALLLVSTYKTDLAIIGGGIAGLWLLNLLRRQGYEAVLIEKTAIGEGQTLASQGMIHGGIKYALSGKTTGASETIADMPGRWQQCLDGQGTLDLSGVKLRAQQYHMFSDNRISSKVTTFFGSRAIKGRVSPVPKADFPPVFQHPDFSGLLYQLADIVIDTPSLLAELMRASKGYMCQGDPKIEHKGSTVSGLILDDGQRIEANTYVFTAGEGNAKFIEQMGLDLSAQSRPLHQVIVQGANLPELYAHAVTLKSADKPRITFTTHASESGNTWYLGGQLAESGVTRSESDQIEFAKKEIHSMLPWIDLSGCSFSTLRINRAEAGTSEGLRPDTPFVERFGNTLVCWPTKLTLVPMMGDRFMSLMNTPLAIKPGPIQRKQAELGKPPWQ